MTTYELDELQLYLKKTETIHNAKEYLKSLKIDEKFTKLYLSTYLFVKIPDFFVDLNDEFKLLVDQIHKNENLFENLPKYENMFNEWKQNNAASLVDEIQYMKKQTRSSSSETENENCKFCYNTQQNILSIAETFFMGKNE